MQEINIINKEKILDYFGYFPTFHDNEIINVEMNRNGPNISLKIYSFDFTKNLNNKHKFQKIKECEIEFLFKWIVNVKLQDFNHQNVIEKMTFNNDNNNIKAIITSSFGANGYIISKSVIIQSLNELY